MLMHVLLNLPANEQTDKKAFHIFQAITGISWSLQSSSASKSISKVQVIQVKY